MKQLAIRTMLMRFLLPGFCLAFPILWVFPALLNQDSAPDELAVCGSIVTEYYYPVEGVEVSLTGLSSYASLTNSNGGFCFLEVEEGASYVITPLKDSGGGEGISLFDVVLISKHILGLQPIDNPYRLIAADVNNSSSITALDLLALRRFLLGIDSSFPNNTRWRFVLREYLFPDPQNPWQEPFPEEKTVSPVNYPNGIFISQHEFIGIEVGNVNLD